MKSLSLLLLPYLLSEPQAALIPNVDTFEAKILSVGDGDTVRVKTGDTALTVRLACIDAPELKQPEGIASAKRLKQLLPINQVVNLKVVGMDNYRRAIAKVYLGQQSVNLALVQEGQAVVYRQYLKACPDLKASLLKAEGEAKSKKLGLWSSPNPMMPWDFRRFSKPKETLKTELPLCVKTQCRCKDFKNQQEAQRVLRTFPADPFKLDRDRDGIACDGL
jgi:micrococcal nuclease